MKHPGIFCVWAALHITAFDAVGFATFARDVFSTAVVIWRKGIFRIGSPNCFALVKFLLADGQPVGGLCFLQELPSCLYPDLQDQELIWEEQSEK